VPHDADGPARRNRLSLRSNSDIIKVTWHRNRPGQFQVVFNHGPLDRMPGGRDQAQELADKLGFVLLSDASVDHLAEWGP
jgi:hypothetical protein